MPEARKLDRGGALACAATRDPAVRVLHLDGSAGLPDADGPEMGSTADFLRRLESVALPTVATVGGACDASALALLTAATLGFVTGDITVRVEARAVLGLGLTSSLPGAVGAAPTRSLLLGTGVVEAAELVRCGLAHPAEDAAAAIERLADPSAALLVRSLRVAARSTQAQAREYDAELRHIG
jgi:enoyl-CoA hydratase/carnithine racemase